MTSLLKSIALNMNSFRFPLLRQASNAPGLALPHEDSQALRREQEQQSCGAVRPVLRDGLGGFDEWPTQAAPLGLTDSCKINCCRLYRHVSKEKYFCLSFFCPSQRGPLQLVMIINKTFSYLSGMLSTIFSVPFASSEPTKIYRFSFVVVKLSLYVIFGTKSEN